MSKLFVVSVCFVAETDVILLDFLLSVLAKKTDSKWLLANDMSGEIAIVDIDSESGQNLCKKLIADDESSIVMAYGTDNKDLNPSFFLKKPMRSAEFISLVDDMLNKFPETGKQASILSTDTETTNEELHLSLIKTNSKVNIKRQKIQRLWNLIEEKKYSCPITITDEKISLYIDFENNCYSSNHESKHLSALYKKDIRSLEITEAPKLYFETTTMTPPQQLDELLWCSTLLGSCGELNTHINEDTMLHLIRWPNFSSLVHSPKHITLTAYMTQHSCPIKTISADTGITPEDIINFINACYLLGYLDTKKHKEKRTTTLATPKNINLFNKIRKKFGINMY